MRTRQILYSLTCEGGAALEKAKPLWQQAHRETLHQLDAAAATLRVTLQAVSAALRA